MLDLIFVSVFIYKPISNIIIYLLIDITKFLNNSKFYQRFADYLYCNIANFGNTSYIKLFSNCALYSLCNYISFK